MENSLAVPQNFRLVAARGWLAVTVKVAQSCPALSNSMDYTVHGILQARILEWVAFPFSRGIFPTQGSNPGLLHYRQILYQLSHKGSPDWNRGGEHHLFWEFEGDAGRISQSLHVFHSEIENFWRCGVSILPGREA